MQDQERPQSISQYSIDSSTETTISTQTIDHESADSALNRINLILKTTEKIENFMQGETNDLFDTFGKVVAQNLRRMPLEDGLCCQRDIMALITEYGLKKLRQSTITS